MREMVPRSPAPENFGSREYALALLIGLPPLPFVLIRTHLAHAGIIGVWIPSLLLLWVFAAIRYFRPAMMPPVLLDYSEHILLAKRLSNWCVWAALAMIGVSFLLAGITTWPALTTSGFLSCVCISGAFLLHTYTQLRTESKNKHMRVVASNGRLLVVAIVCVSAGVFTWRMWGSFWAVPWSYICVVTFSYLSALLRQRFWPRSEGPGGDDAGSSLPVGTGGGPVQGASHAAAERF